MSYVTKRDGSREELNLDKLHKVVFWATEGLTGVSASEVEMKSQIQFYNNIKTRDIQETMVKAAADLISEESPNYQYVAGRMVNYLLRKEVYKRFQPSRLYNLIQANIELGFYDPKLLTEYTEEEWDEINGFVNHERDMSLTYAAMEQMRGKYLVQNRVTGQILETPQVLYILVAAVLFSKEPKATRLKWVHDYYESISKHEISLPTPIMAGVRTPIRQFSSCFPAGQLVYTQDGFQPIQDIKVGTYVMTRTGTYHPVLATRSKMNQQKFVSFTHNLYFDDEFKTTSDHRILVARKPSQASRKTTEPEWVEADQLKVGDFVQIPFNQDTTPLENIKISDYVNLDDLKCDVDENGVIRKKIANPDRYDDKREFSKLVTSIPNSLPLDENFHRMIGYYLAEGHVMPDKCVCWTFGSHEHEWIADVEDYFRSIGYEVTKYTHSVTSTTVSIHSKIFARFIMALCGTDFNKKRLPSILMKSTKANQKALLHGVIRGDGCVHKDGMTLNLANRELIQQIAHIMLRCGLYPSLFKTKPGTPRYHQKRDIFVQTRHTAYGINLAYGPNFDFIREVGKNIHKLRNWSSKNTYGVSKYINKDFFTRIRNVSITNDAPIEPVYDLQIDNDQSFTVSNLAVHNCTLIECGDSLDSITATTSAIVKYVSQRAGIGIGAGGIRALGSPVRNGDTSHTGVTPFFKLFQAAVNSCNQGGVRKGSSTVFFAFFHLEVETMLVLKNNKGVEDNRVRHMDYGIQFNKLFYERVLSGGDITLFSPNDVPEVYEAFFSDYDRFKELYETAERNTRLRKKKIKAVDLFAMFIQERKETARIYLQNVDNSNTHSSFDEKVAPVRMSNLCLEITLPTVPMATTHVETVTVAFDDLPIFMQKIQAAEKTMRVVGTTDDGVVIETTEDLGRIALCTLSAINWGVVKSPSEFERIGRLAVRALDNLLDYQEYPIYAARKHTEEYRPLGIGIINFAYFLAKNGVKYSDGSALALVDEWAEAWSHSLIKASVELAKERGPCKLIQNTKYAKGIVPIDTRKLNVDELLPHRERADWESLREDLRIYGIRNATVMALMPSETSAQLSNSTNGIEPPRAFVSIKQSKHGVLKQVVPDFRRLKNKYELLWDQKSPEGYLHICAILQKYIDMAISVNTTYNQRLYPGEQLPISILMKDILQFYKYGGKTLYYFNITDGAGEIDVETMKTEDEACDSCTI